HPLAYIGGLAGIGIVTILVDRAGMRAAPPHLLVGGGVDQTADTAVYQEAQGKITIAQGVLHAVDPVRVFIAYKAGKRIRLGKTIALVHNVALRVLFIYGCKYLVRAVACFQLAQAVL